MIEDLVILGLAFAGGYFAVSAIREVYRRRKHAEITEWVRVFKENFEAQFGHLPPEEKKRAWRYYCHERGRQE
jgi:hypothetical protein